MDETIKKLLAPGKGILAADESTKTITKRFAVLGLTSIPELNKEYREMLFTTPGLENYLSGVILYEESVDQGLHKILEEKGIVPGIKVDEGLEKFEDTDQETTKGLEGLPERLKKYAEQGLKFTKWRAAIVINDKYPSDNFLDDTLGKMAEYAKLSQEAGLVPIPEPEILLDGLHTTTRCAEITEKTLGILFTKLKEKGVDLTKILLKTSMIMPGKDNGVKAAPFEIAQFTLRGLKKTVPPEVPGIVFLSGGQTPEQVFSNLNEIVKQKSDSPWDISFSFARALQEDAMKAWEGRPENVNAAQAVFLKRLIEVSKARKGEYE